MDLSREKQTQAFEVAQKEAYAGNPAAAYY